MARQIPLQIPVVEVAPSHDGAPTFTAYTTDENNSDRPLFALVVYVTTEQASQPDYVRDLSLQIHKGTERERRSRMIRNYRRDRIEVVGLPKKKKPDGNDDLNQSDSEEESDEACAARCQAHYLAEVAARTATGSVDFFLPPTFNPSSYTRQLLILRQLNPGWEVAALFREPAPPPNEFAAHVDNFEGLDPFPSRKPPPQDVNGRVLRLFWAPTEAARQEYEEEDEDLPDPLVQRGLVEQLARYLAEGREFMDLLDCYVEEGRLDAALQAA